MVAGNNMPAPVDVGGRIREARRRAGLTQQQLADGRYSKAYVSALENGHAKPSMAALNFFSERLGLPASSFLGDSSGAWDRLSADLALASGDWSNAIEAYQSLLLAATDRTTRAELQLSLTEALCRVRRGDTAIALATEAVETFRALRRPEDAAQAAYWLANAHLQADNRGEARLILVALLEELRRQRGRGPDLRLRTLMALGIVEGMDEQYRRAIAYYEEAMALTPDLDARRRASLLHSLAGFYTEVNDIEGAIRAGQEALALYRAADAQFEVASLENQLALAYLANGNLARASRHAGLARMRHELERDERMLGHVAETQAQIAIAQGRLDDAVVLSQEAIDFARRVGNPAGLTNATLTLARAHSSAGNVLLASEIYAEAVTELRVRGPVFRLQRGLTEWAELLARLGRHKEAYLLSREALHATTVHTPSPDAAAAEGRGSAAKPVHTAPARRTARSASRAGTRVS